MSNRLTAGELIHLLAKIDPATEIHWLEDDPDRNGYLTCYIKSLGHDGYLINGDMIYCNHEEDFEDEDD